jgi:dihydrofolate synthase/folylpolyglutamate synthase
MLGKAGYKVGLFTSPHLSSVRERFRINDQFISELDFARHASMVRVVLGEEKITYFEFTTALAMLWFEEMKVDLVVLETGLGGRLDATNVVKPLVSVITNVSMDHEAYLGNDLRSITSEKAGIIKERVPLVTAVDDGVCLEVVSERCRQMDAPMYLFGRDFRAVDNGNQEWCWRGNSSQLSHSYTNLRCGMRGDYQRSNSSLAIAVLVLLGQLGFPCGEVHVRQGLIDVHWPGRLEYIAIEGYRGDGAAVQGKEGKTLHYLVDGAHNPAGVQSLVQTLVKEYSYKRLIVLWGAMEDKDLRQTVGPIAEMASVMVLTKPQGERAADPEMLFEVLPEQHQRKCHKIIDRKQALSFVQDQATSEDLIVIAGSLYLIGEMRNYLVGGLV